MPSKTHCRGNFGRCTRLDIVAHGLCPPHDRASRRGRSIDYPIRERTAEKYVRLGSVKVRPELARRVLKLHAVPYQAHVKALERGVGADRPEKRKQR